MKPLLELVKELETRAVVQNHVSDTEKESLLFASPLPLSAFYQIVDEIARTHKVQFGNEPTLFLGVRAQEIVLTLWRQRPSLKSSHSSDSHSSSTSDVTDALLEGRDRGTACTIPFRWMANELSKLGKRKRPHSLKTFEATLNSAFDVLVADDIDDESDDNSSKKRTAKASGVGKESARRPRFPVTATTTTPENLKSARAEADRATFQVAQSERVRKVTLIAAHTTLVNLLTMRVDDTAVVANIALNVSSETKKEAETLTPPVSAQVSFANVSAPKLILLIEFIGGIALPAQKLCETVRPLTTGGALIDGLLRTSPVDKGPLHQHLHLVVSAP